ncbi:SDR family oxidoreductase [Amycolatopsis sp.]|uniref:SDR family NAD(P)-dependent oxidoreductase n=1 Tax=Amycolatopsis sp. TaxID=37632 RepID=UPI002D801E47|nr:SDR family oxidoreductase [Amycolatopsis sp.]HET6709841.1 SDR family oxidoreductase [Amycolatopsis sp.]
MTAASPTARVIVTGAGSGIGRATAVRIAAEGGHVVAADLDPARLDDLVGQCGEEAVTALAGDITEPETVRRIVAAAGGRIDGLANVAGIMDGFPPPSEVDDAVWDRVLGINLTATMRLTRAVLPAMIEAGHGSIVNVASEAALRGSAAGPTITGIDGGMRSAYAAGRGGPVMQATMPAPAAPGQVAASIVWLLSDDATNINGVVLPSDGGWSVA